jgi:hypothetical protein
MKRYAFLLAVVLALASAAASAQTLTGTIRGRVVDEQGGVLPGATVVLTGRQGSQTTVTDERGEYQFVGLNPGTYEVRAELSGFAPQTERDIALAIGRTLSVNFTLKVSGLAETVDVVAGASAIDVTTTATDTTLSSDLLQNIPINLGTFNTATALLNYAPGINNSSAFGGDGSFGNALLIDGVDTRDPEGGSAWVFYNYNIVEEVQFGGLGAPAEYGGFSGAVVNTITKSGGNMYSGLFEYRYTGEDLAGKNLKKEYLDKNPSLGDAAVLKNLKDYTVQLGGPFRKDKAFYWFSVQRYAFELDPSGPRTIQTEVSPRYNGKVTFQLSPSDTVNVGFQWDNYNVTGRSGKPGATFSTDRQTVRQDSPEAFWNTQYRKVFGSNAFLEVKYTGWWGYYYLDPVDPSPSRLDLGTGEYSGGAGFFYYADRGRNQVNAALTAYADAYGKHNFKFGLEIERSKSRSRYGYTDSIYYLDYYGAPYLAYAYSYDIDGRNRRVSGYAQDQWQVGRLTANLGLRLDRIRGYSPAADRTIYTPKLSVNPRLGVAVDAFGTGKSVLKAFWGRYYEGASFNPWQRAVPGRSDYITYEVLPNGTLVEIDRIPELIYKIDPDITHLSLDEFNASFEQQIRRDMKFTASWIYRDYKNFINGVIPAGTWAPFTYTGGLPNQPLTLYRLTNRAVSIDDRLIRNVDGFQYRDAAGNVLGTANPYRNYKGFMAVLSKSFRDRWQAQASYVWSEAKGTVDNSGTASVTGSQFLTPNGILVNADGRMLNDRTHEFKFYGGYEVPRLDVLVSAAWRAMSGRTYNAQRVVGGSTFNYPSSLTINLEQRGRRRLEKFQQVDLRLEKSFRYDVHRFSVFVDIQNLFNDDTIFAVQTRYPSRTIAGAPVAFEAPTQINTARQVTIGGKWTF